MHKSYLHRVSKKDPWKQFKHRLLDFELQAESDFLMDGI